MGEREPIRDSILHNLKARSYAIYSRLPDIGFGFRNLNLSNEDDELQKHVLIYSKTRDGGVDIDRISYILRKGNFLESYTFDFTNRQFRWDSLEEEVNTDGVVNVVLSEPGTTAPLNLAHGNILVNILLVAEAKSISFQGQSIKWN